MKVQVVSCAAPLQAQGSCAGLPGLCDSALCQGKPGGMHLNAVGGAEFDSSGLEQSLVPKRQAWPNLLLV